MVRLIFYGVVLILFARAMMRLWQGVLEGMGHQPRRGHASVPQRGVQMARDPVCGTFVIPEQAVTLTVGRQLLHFCSDACRDKYRAGRTA